MSDLQRLAALFRELEELLTRCMRCGFCQSVCPLYEATGLETDVARGKLSMLAGLGDGILDDPAGVRSRLERCLLCGSCAAGCPSGAPVMEIYLKARAILAGYMGLSPAKRLVLRGMLARPALFDGVMSVAPKVQGVFAKAMDPELDTSCARLGGPLANRHFKRLAPRPLHSLLGPVAEKTAGPKPRAAFFWGCLIDKLYPNVGLATLKALEHHGIAVLAPRSQPCCGMPALAAGDLETLRRLMEAGLKRFDPRGLDVLITACATCSAAIKKLWPLLAPQVLPGRTEEIDDLASKVKDISQVLAPLARGRAASGSGPVVTYHDPCHLKKSLGVSDEPRQVLVAAGADFREMAGADQCCGMGGSFSLEHSELSTRIGGRKLGNIKAAGARVTATSCPACMVQLSDAASRDGGGVAVKHVIEIYADSLPGAAEGGNKSPA